MTQFYNYINETQTDDAVESREIGIKVAAGVPHRATRFYIKVGFAGCNTSANNHNGYASKAKAEAVILDYQNRR